MKNQSNKGKLYLAGPISNFDLNERQETFLKYQQIFEERGYEVINPMTLPHEHDKYWESYMKECIVHLVYCDAIFMLPTWELSNGARLEFQIAIKLGIEIVYL